MFDESREKEERDRERESTSTQVNNIESWREHNQCERNFVRCAENIYAFTSFIEHSAFL